MSEAEDTQVRTDGRGIAVVGGGPAGMALALALTRQSFRAEIFEAKPRAAVARDARILALSEGTKQMLDRLGVWSTLRPTPIRTIHVSHRGRFGRTCLKAEEMGLGALGWVLPASDLIAALDAEVSTQAIPYHDLMRIEREAESGRILLPQDGFALTALAEGAVEPSEGTVRDYEQHAVLCTVTTEAGHEHVAWERFTPEGPVALLPLGDGYAVVLVCASAEVERIKALDDNAFLALLQERFGSRHRFQATGPRVAYPLGLRYRSTPVGDRQVWLGNAAQTLHPVAGQGFNLALRDIWELADHLKGRSDPGDPHLLAAYARGRRMDRQSVIGFTNFLIDTFTTDFAPVSHLRGAGLLALDLIPPLRQFVAKRMIFGARAWP